MSIHIEVYSKKQFVPGLFSNDQLSFLQVPPRNVLSNLYISINAVNFFFNHYYFKRRGEVKKSAVLQLKCMNEVN